MPVAGVGSHQRRAGDADPDAGGHRAACAAPQHDELEAFAVGVGLDLDGAQEAAGDDIHDGVVVSEQPGAGVENGLFWGHRRDSACSFHEVIRPPRATRYYAEQDVLCPDPAILFYGSGRGARAGLFSRQETQAHDSN